MKQSKRVIKTELLSNKRKSDVRSSKELLDLTEKINAALTNHKIKRCKEQGVSNKKRILDNKVHRVLQMRAKFNLGIQHSKSIEEPTNVNLVLDNSSRERLQQSIPHIQPSNSKQKYVRYKSNSLGTYDLEISEKINKSAVRINKGTSDLPFLFRTPTKKQIRRFETMSKLYSREIQNIEKLSRFEEGIRSTRKKSLLQKIRSRLPFSMRQLTRYPLNLHSIRIQANQHKQQPSKQYLE